MKTTVNAEQVNKIAALNIKDGSKKSLTAQLKSVLGASQAKNLSDAIVAKFGGKFTKSNVIEMVKNGGDIKARTGKAISPKGKKSTRTSKLASGTSKNEQIRMMLNDGMSITEIRKDLDLSYQRVKNVKKAMDTKGSKKK